ncbi:Glycosyltransferase [Rhynchospora pubera]|uniref:Glycosyltransferase n=1 Tax=Rhynchospora pubera TaxID=906938 RepID=A0AAV8EHV3_9POAL|nr:Glycosyltransferase [Rhynchospora pubera]
MEITNNYPKVQAGTPHFLMLPWLAPGHLIPTIDIARLLAEHNAAVTIITTPVNAARIKPTIDRSNAASAGNISLVSLYFPATEVGLPEGCENIDLVPSMPLVYNFCQATKLFRQQVSRYIRELAPRVSCIISGMGYVWAVDVAHELGVPCFIFHGFGSFALCCSEILHKTKEHEDEVLVPASSAEPFIISGLPFEFKITRKELPLHFPQSKEMKEIGEEMRSYELAVDGILVNSFEQLEPGYADLLQNLSGKKVFTMGPVSVCNTKMMDMEERGNKPTVSTHRCIQWLDSKKPKSVVYVSFGSTGSFAPKQFKELGLGLLASQWPFVWVIKDIEKLPEETLIWLRENFEDKNSSRSLLIKGWAPQIAILSHPAVGGFLTHCGWNSTLESVAAGVPVVAWPLYSEQFLNVKLIVDVLKIGVSVGAREAMAFRGDKEDGIRVWKEDVVKAIEKLMNGEEERKRVAQLKEKAEMALEKGGSSFLNLESLIQSVAP